MSNPYLPRWEYIPDGEPRVFGDRIYLYGSHDRAGSVEFCDYVLKCWSAPLAHLDQWVCHGDIFRTRETVDHKPDTDWTDRSHYLYAPDVVEKDGKYYLYAYIIGSIGCVAVSDKPEGPFHLLRKYQYTISDEICCNGWFIDPGVLVDDDGRTYIYCGFERSFMAEINSERMYEVVDGSCVEHIIPCEKQEDGGFTETDALFYEACSPRKIGDTYYLIYSPKRGSRLAYATAACPTGPFTYRGYIVDNGVEYPGGNNHGSIAKINGQWYVFYHRMTNGTIMSRRACVEKIQILPDGTIPAVEMTSLGFEEALNPYEMTAAEIACVLEGGAFVTEKHVFERVVTNVTEGCVIGYKYFDFGDDFGSKTMELAVSVNGMGCDSILHVLIDKKGVDGEDQKNREDRENGEDRGNGEDEKDERSRSAGEEIGQLRIGRNGGVITGRIKAVTGRHSLFFRVSTEYPPDWTGEPFRNRCLFEMKEFVFMK